MKLNKSIKWSKYPSEPPKQSGTYLVTMVMDTPLGDVLRFAINEVSYSKKYDLWCANDESRIPDGKDAPDDSGFTEKVVAWAEKIEVVPYAG